MYTRWLELWNRQRRSVVVGRPFRLRRTSHHGGQAGYLCSEGTGLVPNYSQNTLSRVTFIGPDGTEMNLIDKKSGGQPQPYALGEGTAYYDRGAVWVTHAMAPRLYSQRRPDKTSQTALRRQTVARLRPTELTALW